MRFHSDERSLGPAVDGIGLRRRSWCARQGRHELSAGLGRHTRRARQGRARAADERGGGRASLGRTPHRDAGILSRSAVEGAIHGPPRAVARVRVRALPRRVYWLGRPIRMVGATLHGPRHAGWASALALGRTTSAPGPRRGAAPRRAKLRAGGSLAADLAGGPPPAQRLARGACALVQRPRPDLPLLRLVRGALQGRGEAHRPWRVF